MASECLGQAEVGLVDLGEAGDEAAEVRGLVLLDGQLGWEREMGDGAGADRRDLGGICGRHEVFLTGK